MKYQSTQRNQCFFHSFTIITTDLYSFEDEDNSDNWYDSSAKINVKHRKTGEKGNIMCIKIVPLMLL